MPQEITPALFYRTCDAASSIRAATSFGTRDVDRVTGARDFDRVALGSCGVPPFEVGVDGSVFRRHQHPAWFTSPRRRGDDGLKIISEVEHLRARHESGLYALRSPRPL